ncbi:homeobox protein Hox-A9 isoform X1 [Rissa tridactyla]|uniref:homeobox protein Hox-A9 isoform X1 n=1 Tax=Rissa tridactyla TaxID=75485 RepID=UPI0023BA5B00|nr:homeobox protein Hox-A9 isoform X1 [Rissa tridactyla]
MSAPGTLSNYYVDSFLVAEGDELAAPRYAPAPLGPPPPPPPRPAGLAEHPELAPCSFQPKAPVFGPPWSPAHPAGASGVPAVYHHPYAHHQAPPDGRYMRSWLEPVPGSLSFPGLPTGRHYGIKPEPLAARRADCTTFDTHTLSLSDYACGSPPVDRDKQSHEGAFSESNGESEANGEKPQIDPSRGGCCGAESRNLAVDLVSCPPPVPSPFVSVENPGLDASRAAGLVAERLGIATAINAVRIRVLSGRGFNSASCRLTRQLPGSCQ